MDTIDGFPSLIRFRTILRIREWRSETSGPEGSGQEPTVRGAERSLPRVLLFPHRSHRDKIERVSDDRERATERPLANIGQWTDN